MGHEPDGAERPVTERVERVPSRRALQWYVYAVSALGAVALVQAITEAPSAPRPVAWLLVAGVAIAAGSFKLNFAAVSADIAVDDTFFITIALLFGPGPATLATAAGGFVLPVRRRRPLRQVAFNTAALAISMSIASRTFFALARVRPLATASMPIAPLVVPVLALTAVYFVLNSGLTAVAIGLDTDQSPLYVWRRHFQWVSINYFAAASVAFCFVLLIEQSNVVAFVIVLPLLAIFHLTLRASFGRVEDARRHLADVDRLYLSTVETLAMAIDAKDDVTHSHVRRVQAYAMALARALGITDELTLKALEAAALLHDTGKLAVPEHILNKPGKLSDAEFEKMKLHADIGADILSLVRFPYPVEPIVRCHHENWDGTGYPRGTAGEQIPIGARILSVVDCFDALTSDRPYRRRLSDEAAIAILRERSGRMYDPRVVEIFVDIHATVHVDQEETPEQRAVLARISRTRREAEPSPVAATPAAMTDDLVAFVSLARIAAGEHSVLDALGLASKLVCGILPGVTGAWYLPDRGGDRLVVADTFGPHAGIVANLTVDIGARLSGWVAARRQPIVDGDAALDLGVASDGESALRRCTSIPLTVGGSLAGVLTLYASDAAALEGDRARLVQVVAPHVAATIEAARSREAAAGYAADDERPAAPARDLRLVSTR